MVCTLTHTASAPRQPSRSGYYPSSQIQPRRGAVSTCTSARVIRTRLIDGWGIRMTKDGWLYNVSIPHAVLIRLTDGKAVQLGSDEPEALLAALLEAGLELEET